VMPEFVSIIDDPSQPTYEGQPLIGYQAVDDEGVPSKTITLVKEGRLVTLPSSRQPIKKINGSNGHARTLQNQWTIPAVTNLFVKSAKAESREQLMEKLRKLCTETGNEYGLMVTLLEDSRISQDYSWADRNQGEQAPLLSAPILVYKVYAKDGKVEPVRGLVFDEVSIRSLRDIVAMGKDTKVYNILQPAFRQFQYFASIVSPSVLIEEMELKANSAQEPMPISSNPIFEEKQEMRNKK
jgi:TldD protein